MFYYRLYSSDIPMISLLKVMDQSIFQPPWTPQQWDDEIASLTNHVYLITMDCAHSVIAGYFTFGVAGDDIELKKIGVLPEYRRQGVAKDALRFIVEQVQSASYNNMIVEVGNINLSAIKLYKSSGFYTIYTRKRYYQNKIDALVMQKEL